MDDLKAQAGEERMEKREQFKQVQPHGNSQAAPPARGKFENHFRISVFSVFASKIIFSSNYL